jgi:EAL domain-containing protein (putative c-di-GMP-specific phosphodiesterase class I)
MNSTKTPTRESQGAAELQRLPNLDVLLGKIEEELTDREGLGILSITVVRRRECVGEDSWEAYESILREITFFLSKFQQRRMRRTDTLLEPSLSGNTFVILLDRPREDRPLSMADISRVRNRLLRSISAHIGRRLSHTITERFGIFVGGTLMHHEPAADSRRMIYRSLEEAIANAMTRQEEEERQHAVHLREILRSGRIDIVYQPVVEVVERRIMGFEALTRLPQRQFDSPDLLFKVANENGSLWALERLCRRKALESLPPLDKRQMLFLNIEPDSFFDPQLRKRKFLRWIERAGLDPHRLVLEVTEHAAIADFDLFRRKLVEIRSLGFQLAMDDVGAGYAGLQAITAIRPDFIKVDMTLVRDMHLDLIKRELIETIRRFTDSTGIVMIAEGVESRAELESLTRAGVRCAQGYLFAKPDSPPRQPRWQPVTEKR